MAFWLPICIRDLMFPLWSLWQLFCGLILEEILNWVHWVPRPEAWRAASLLLLVRHQTHVPHCGICCLLCKTSLLSTGLGLLAFDVPFRDWNTFCRMCGPAGEVTERMCWCRHSLFSVCPAQGFHQEARSTEKALWCWWEREVYKWDDVCKMQSSGPSALCALKTWVFLNFLQPALSI